MAAILRTSASRVSCRSSSLSATVSARALSLSARSTISRTPTSARPSSFARSLAEQQQQQQLAPRAAWLHVSAVRGKSDAAKWQDQSAPIEYDELKPLTRNPTDDVLVIDVREPDEVILGSIPSSVNMPLSSLTQQLSMDDGDFVKQNGFHKPRLDQGHQQKIVTYCKAGVRAKTAEDLFRRAGYKFVRTYPGSWLDWVAREGKNPDDD